MSFGDSGGGTLTLPSPTHPTHIDVQSAVRSLRRSLSRSPSKFHLARSASQCSDASMSSSYSPNSPSPASPSLRRMASQQFGAFSSQNNAPTTQSVLSQSPLATPFRPSVKLSLRSAKSTAKLNSSGSSTKSASRNRTSPKSPTKRALNSSSPCAGNSTPSSTSESSTPGQENQGLFATRSPVRRRSFERAKSRHSMHLDMSGASLQAIARLGESNTSSATASPLKRSDATMNLDQVSFGSPKAKRRSYGPSNFGADFNALDHGPISPSFDIHDEASRDYDWTGGSGSKTPTEQSFATQPFATPVAFSAPRRTTSLRQSTLQQRQEKKKTSWGRRSGAQHLSQFSNEAASPARPRPRIASDHFMPLSRDSPFSAQGPLPNPSAHTMNQQPIQPHPLSRTMTASSSNSSILDESPTHFPIISEKPRAPMNWSKSLPIGALRPTHDNDTAVVGSLSTPDYKHAKPFSGAFASTGLVSKMRNPELEPLITRGAPVPDTPCKGRVSPFHTFPPLLASNIKRGRKSLGAYGAPTTPFGNPGDQSQAPNTFGSPSGRPNIFASFGSRHGRSNSLLSLYSDDGKGSVDPNGDTPMATAEDVPPTPTRPTSFISHGDSSLDLMVNDSPTANRHIAAPVSALGKGSWNLELAASCKFSPSERASNTGRLEKNVPINGASDSTLPPVRGPTLPTPVPLTSFRRNRAKRGELSTPAPLMTRTISAIEISSSNRNKVTKNDPIIASPLERLDFVESTTPRTPQECEAAPDASRLSISNPTESFLFPPGSGRKSLFPPATPTTRHSGGGSGGGGSLFQDRRVITPTHGNASRQMDASLLGRFANVEFIGQGEFSEVFKVAERPATTETEPLGLFSTPTHRTPPSPTPDKVFAVKKLKLPLKGSSDRALRMREVTALDAVRGYEHVLQLIDSWEEMNNLYIQTEYCEEGSLDVFLAQVGLKGKLDDFRIWKIMLEMSQVSLSRVCYHAQRH